ncbi:MAG: hypothetical protein AAF847_12940 [Bacteroidota bacterium]
MKSILFLLLIGLCYSPELAAQYKTAAGVRLGWPSSLSFKHFINDSDAIEVHASFRTRSSFFRRFYIDAAYQKHYSLDKVADGLRWYAGGGLGFRDWRFESLAQRELFTGKVFLLRGYVGTEYTFKRIPLVVGLDWTPYFFANTDGPTGFGADDGGLSIRYIFKR